MVRGTKKTRSTSRILIALLAVFALILAACGSDSDDDASDNKNGDSDSNGAPSGASGEYELVEGSTPAMLTELDSAMADEEPIVVTLWRPHWAYAEYDIKDLEDPEGAMGEGEEIYGVANKDWAADNAELTEIFKGFTLDDDQLGSLESFVFNEHDGDEEAGVEAWLADGDNQDMVDGWIDEDLDGSGETINIGLIPWDEDIVVTALWKDLLEEQGYSVEVTEVDAGILFQGLADGDIDVFFDTWLPITHQDYWEEHGDSLEKLGKWYDGSAVLSIVVPSYMEDVNSIADLKGRADEFGGQIIGIEPGAGLMRVTKEEAIPTYGL